jgi:hypothetical protein
VRACLLLAAVLLASSGCTAAGLAAAPLVGAVQAIADRSAQRTLPADQESAWRATLEALTGVGVRVAETDRSRDRWRLSAQGDDLTVHGTVERVTPGLSRLSIRVEAGGLLSDKRTAEAILDQVGLALGARRAEPATTRDVSAEQIAALRREIANLGARLEETRRRSAPEAGAAPPSAPVVEPRVIAIPASVGVPIAAGAAGMPGLRALASPGATTPEPTGRDQPREARMAERPDGMLVPPLPLLPAPLKTADVLSPADQLVAPIRDR